MTWIQEALSSLTLTEEAEGYLLGRGAKSDSYENMGEGVWSKSPSPCEDPDFVERYGPYGESLEGLLVCPLYTPRGEPVGFEAKSMRKKYLTRYLVRPKADWNPIWIGRTDAAEKLWSGGEAWIVEGRFDLYPLEWVIPPEDVVLASVRAALTRKHIEYLRRLGVFVNVVYDNDETGRVGTEKALHWLKRAGVPCRKVSYSGGKDPGEIWDQGGLSGLKKSFRR